MRLLATLVFSLTTAELAREVPAYPNTVPIQIGDQLVIGGEYFRIEYFTTSDPLGAVAEYFFQRWKGLGLPTMVDGHPDEDLIVSAFYTREGLQRSIVLKQRAGKTIGFATVRDLHRRAKEGTNEELFSPAEGALWVEDVESTDGAARSQHRTALVEAEFGVALRDIKKQLESAAYVLAREVYLTRDGARQLLLEHVRGERRILTHLAEVEARVTAILQTCVGCAKSDSARDQVTSNAAPREAD
jgi:hypothetical protein